ncbi:conserved hypothetical protein, partial [Ricinus communis]
NKVTVFPADQHERRRQNERGPFHVAQGALATHARPRDAYRRDAFEHQQGGKRHDGEPQRAVERIAEDRHTEHDTQAADHQQLAPADAKIVDAKKNHRETDHDFILAALPGCPTPGDQPDCACRGRRGLCRASATERIIVRFW